MNILILFTGELTYDDSLWAFQFVSQLPLDHEVRLIGPAIPLGLWSGLQLPAVLVDPSFDGARLARLIHQQNPDVILVADGPAMWCGAEGTRIPWEWLDPFADKLAFLDPSGVFRRGKVARPPRNIPVIEPSPPNDGAHALTWQRIDPLGTLAKHGQREQVRQNLGLPSDMPLTVLAFNPPAMMLASAQGWQQHYHEVVQLVAYYLAQLGDPCCMVALGYQSSSDLALPNAVVLKTFLYPSATDLEDVTQAADLLLVENAQHPLLITAQAAGVPAMVLGSRQTPELIDSLAPVPQKAARRLAETGALFPYVSFPFPSDYWTDNQPVSHRFAYYLADVLNESDTMALIRRALQDGLGPNKNAARGRAAHELLLELSGSG